MFRIEFDILNPDAIMFSNSSSYNQNFVFLSFLADVLLMEMFTFIEYCNW